MAATKKSNIEKVIEGIEKMTVLELSDLVKQLEEKFGVTAAAPVMAPAMMPAGGEAGGGEAAEEKTEFDVVLAAVGEKKLSLIHI